MKMRANFVVWGGMKSGEASRASEWLSERLHHLQSAALPSLSGSGQAAVIAASFEEPAAQRCLDSISCAEWVMTVGLKMGAGSLGH